MGHLISRPIIGITCSFIAGVVIGLTIELPFVWVSVVAAGCALAGACSYRYRFADLFLFGSIIGIGLMLTILHVNNPSPAALNHFVGNHREKIIFQGIVCDDPSVGTLRNKKVKTWRFPVNVVAVQRGEEWRQVNGRVIVSLLIPLAEDRPRYGQMWLLSGPLRPYPAFGQRVGWSYSLWAQEAELLDGYYGNWLVSWCLRQRHRCSGILTSGLRDFPLTIRVLRSFLLGYQGVLTDELRRALSMTGTFHVIAISGSHVVAVAAFLIVILRICRLSLPNWGYVIIPIVTIYVIATGADPSAVRAGIMAGICWLAPMLRRRLDTPASLAWSALLILIGNPLNLFRLSFMLTYVAVVGILVYNKYFLELGGLLWCQEVDYSLKKEVPRGIKVNPLVGACQRFGKRTFRLICELLTVSLAAWLVTTPIIIYYFGVVSLIGIPLNLIVVPMFSLILFVGILTLSLGAISSFAAEVFNHANRLFIDIVLYFVNFGEKLPGAYLQFEKYNWRWLVLWYAALFLLVIKDRWYQVAVVFLFVGTAAWDLWC